MKTWLTSDENWWVFRHNEYGDEPEWIGTIETSKDGKDRWFVSYGDNRTLSLDELKQLVDFVENVNSELAMNKRILNSAINKCVRFKGTNQWVGYLVDAEIVALIDAGAKPVNGCERHVERARSNIKNGISSPIWFYLYPNGLKMRDSLEKH